MHTLTFARCNDRTGYYNIINLSLLCSVRPLAPLTNGRSWPAKAFSLIKQLI